MANHGASVQALKAVMAESQILLLSSNPSKPVKKGLYLFIIT
jgi:hypothetical protein